MNDDDRWRLGHMADYLRSAMNFVRDRQRDDLDNDKMLVLALMRAIEVVGEAASKVSAEGRAELPDLPWPEVIGMRNRLVHAYFFGRPRHPVGHSHRRRAAAGRTHQRVS